MSVTDSDSHPLRFEDDENGTLPCHYTDRREVKGTDESLPREWEDEGEEPFEYDDYQYADAQPFEYDHTGEEDAVSRTTAAPNTCEPMLSPYVIPTATTRRQTGGCTEEEEEEEVNETMEEGTEDHKFEH